MVLNFRAMTMAFGVVILAGCAEAQPEKTPLTTQNIAIRVEAGPRQKFAGFGTSLVNWRGNYQKLTAGERTELSRLLWRDLKFKTLRMWFHTEEFAPTPGAHDLTVFRRNYVDSGIIANAKKEGVTTLLLAPDGLPEGMKGKSADGKTVLKDPEAENYAVLLADFIQHLRDETGVLLNATGVQNEPNDNERFSPAQIVSIVKRLRRELDARGLKSVQIIAPEHASSDGVLYEQVDALKNDAEAWKALSGVASHSYNMAATDEIARRIAAPDGQNLKDYWMTEASDNGAEAPGDAFRAASLASRFLNDMNHRVTHWIHFIGFEVPDPKDNATRILSFTAEPLRTTLFQKYFYYQQLSNAFDVGAIFRDSKSTLDGDMTWTYGQKPRVTAGAAQNPDGSWSIGLSNYTADSFAGVQGWSDEKWNREQGGYTPGQSFQVTVNIEELKGHTTIPFALHRSSGKLQNADEGKISMQNGQITLSIAPLELVTLRSSAIKSAP